MDWTQKRARLDQQFGVLVATTVADRVKQALQSRFEGAMSRTRTVTRRGDTELTKGYERCGKKRHERERVMRQAIANRVSVYWGFKGLGQAYGYGFYNVQKFRFTDTETYDATPVFLFDLTSTPNSINGIANAMNPGYRMFVNRSTSPASIVWKALNDQNLSGSVQTIGKGTANVQNGLNGWQCISTQGTSSAANQYPYAQDYISNIDIKLGFFAARNVPSRFTYDVISLPESLCPYNDSDDGTKIDKTNGDPVWHSAYWMNHLFSLTNHPLQMQKGVKAGAQHTGFWTGGAMKQLFEKPKSHLNGGAKTINFDPKSTSLAEQGVQQSGRSEFRTINMYPERVVDLAYRNRSQYTGVTDGVNNTNTGEAQVVTDFSLNYQLSPRPEQRMYLLIESTDFSDLTIRDVLGAGTAQPPTSGTTKGSYWGGKMNDVPQVIVDGTLQSGISTVDFGNSGSFDVNIIKKCIRNN